jgi:iron complex outermembrane receptor protein
MNFSSLAPTTGASASETKEAWTGEVGTRGRVGAFIWDVAFYHAKLRKELLTYAVNPAQGIPAPTFNADETTHQGLEAGLDWEIMNGLRLRQTYMWSDFRFKDDVQYSDNRLPVVPEHFYRAELRYRTQDGFWIAPSVEWSIKDTYVDYMNTLKAPSYGVFNLGLGQEFKGGVSLFVDIRNLTDERYVSNFTAVTNAQTASTAVFFPGDARSVYGGVALTF